MTQGARTRRFAAPLGLLAVLLTTSAPGAATLARQCRRECADEIAACVAAGGRHLACRRQTLARCRREGLAVCQSADAQPRQADVCRSRKGHSCPATTSTSTTTSTTATSSTTLNPTTTTTSATVSTTTTTVPNACGGLTVIPAQGGTFGGTTIGTST